MKRRDFLRTGLAAPAVAAAQEGPPRQEPVESMIPEAGPAIALNHLGFLPQSRKVVIYRYAGEGAPQEFTIRDVAGYPQPLRQTRPMQRVTSDVIDCMAGDFTDLQREGMYQVAVGEELSVPFCIRPDIWRRTLPKAAGYYRCQRCGAEVPNVHAACHLDDARRRDTGDHVDVAGGWHDAGDLRKWMTATQMNGIGLLHLARNLGEHWDAARSGLAPLLEEVRWGNRYFHRMQDRDGLVWADTAGGINGDNSDNHWTDNRAGTADDRYVNTAKIERVQAMFSALQAMCAQAFRASDAPYSEACRRAATLCWNAARRSGNTGDISWWALAAAEMHRATRDEAYARAGLELGGQLLALQNAVHVGSQKEIRGFWRTSEADASPYTDAVYSGIPAAALLELASEFPELRAAVRWRDAVRLYLDEYVLPLAAHSAYEIVPYGVFTGSPTKERYRPLAGDLTYRYFMPVRKQFWWLGTTSHLESHAVLLGMAARTFGNRRYRDLAYRQLEWIMGANPFGACLMTGEGMRNPYPHSRFVGLIPGGIMNGIAGNAKDDPILDTAYGLDWRTTEYWSPHVAYYLWAVSTLES